MLSSLFEKRNQNASTTEPNPLFAIVTKKVDSPKLIISQLPPNQTNSS